MPLPRLILLPGLACDARLFAPLLPGLKALLPEGTVPHISDAHGRHATIEAMAGAVLADSNGPLLLVGVSMGGMVALEAARQAPARIAGLAILGSNARPETPAMLRLRESAIELFERGEAQDVIAFNAPFAFHPARGADRALVQSYVQMVLDAGTGQLIAQNRAVMHRPDARVHLPQLRCPLLMLCGDSDRLTPPECGREIAALAPLGRYVEIAQCGHMLTLEQPEAVTAALVPWLRQLLSN